MLRRWPTTLLLLVMLTALLAACGGDGDDDNDAPDAASPSAGAAATPTTAVQAAPTIAVDASPTAAANAAPDAGTADANPTECVTEYDESVDYFPNKVEAEYARGWSVTYANNYKVITVDPSVELGTTGGATESQQETYVLVQCGTPEPELTGELADAQVFPVPVDTYWEGGGGTWAALAALGQMDSVIGWVAEPTEVEQEYIPELRELAERGDVVAVDYGASLEPVVAAAPDVYVQYNGPEFVEDARQLGIPVVHYSPFSESPLGSAEQVKFVSLFFNSEATANEVFDPIETTYLELQALAAEAAEKPTVLLGNISGEGQFVSRDTGRIESILIDDAGGERLLPELQSFVPTDLETVIAAAADADFWFSMAYTPVETTAAEFIASNPLNEEFQALPAGSMFHRFKRGEDYFSTGGLRVDWLLEDMVSILHPDLLPDHELRFLERIPGSE